MDYLLESWLNFYDWAGVQPLFIQVLIALAMLVTGYFVLAFATILIYGIIKSFD